MAQNCATCIYGKKLVTEGDVLCIKYGIVSEEFACKKYQFDLTTKNVRRKRAPLSVQIEPVK